MFDSRSDKTGCEGRGVAQRTAVSHGPRDAVAGGPRNVLLLGGGAWGSVTPEQKSGGWQSFAANQKTM